MRLRLLCFLLASIIALDVAEAASASASDRLNKKTRFPSHVSQLDTKSHLEQVWQDWNTQENFTASMFSTTLMDASVPSKRLLLDSWSFSIPKNSLLKGIQFSMEQCSMGVTHDWRVEAYLSIGSALLHTQPLKTVMHFLSAGTACYAVESSVTLGGASLLWGLGTDFSTSDLEKPDFGIQIQVFIESSGRSVRDDNTTAPESSNTTEPSPTTTTSTASSTSTTTATSTTTTTSLTTTSTTAPYKPGLISFRNPTMTITYDAPCDFEKLIPEVWCNDEGLSVLDSPAVLSNPDFEFTSSSLLLLDMQAYREQIPAPPKVASPFITVTGKFVLNGRLQLLFSKIPEDNVVESWTLFVSESGGLSGKFLSVTANATNLNWLQEQEWKTCEEFSTVTEVTSRFFSVTTRRHNKCWEAVGQHPAVVAAIVLSVFGVLFTSCVLFVLWRKRRFERSRAAVLSSPLSDEAEMQEMRMADSKSYSEAAKMIESTSGRFEIGDDDIDDPHAPEL